MIIYNIECIHIYKYEFIESYIIIPLDTLCQTYRLEMATMKPLLNVDHFSVPNGDSPCLCNLKCQSGAINDDFKKSIQVCVVFLWKPSSIKAGALISERFPLTRETTTALSGCDSAHLRKNSFEPRDPQKRMVDF